MNTQNSPTTESTELQKTTTVKKEGRSPKFWQSVLVGGVPGILIGVIGSNAVENAFAKLPETDNTEIEDGTPTDEPQEIHVASSVTDDMSFSEAFAAARNEVGPGGAFTWHGHVYGTYRGDDPEWQEMTPEERAEHSQAIISQVHPSPYTPTENEPEIVPAQEEDEDTPNAPTGAPEGTSENHDDSVDVHIVDVSQVQSEDGRTATVGFGTLNGHYAEFVDSDGDGEVDTVLLDANDNQVLDEGEVHSASGVTVDDMISEMQANNATAVDDALYGDMPDYTNDADTSSLC